MLSLTPWRGMTELLPRIETPLGMMTELDRFANRLLGWPMMVETEWRYPLTMEERENEVVARIELPGFTPEEVRVETLAGRLTIVAERGAPPPEGQETRPAREHIRVRREITLPEGINLEGVEATFRNGILEVHLPRTPEAQPRRIEVKT